MTLSDALIAALRRHGAEVERDAPLSRRTWWRVGGPADALVTAPSLAAVQVVQAEAAAAGVPVTVLGNGSNVLVHDDGVEGIVLLLTGDLAASSVDGDLASAGGGLANAVWLARLRKAQRIGLACLAGIPGTVGGAVAMNAGSALGELSDVLVDIDVVTTDGLVQTLPADVLALSYRHCALPDGAVVVRARARLSDDPDEPDRVRDFLARRKATQPLDKPSCGSTFTNPPGDAAGRLIDAAGLKGHRIGGAVVSDKHANFLLNTGEATAADLAALIAFVQDEVQRVHGVRLTPEVRRLGRWDRAPAQASSPSGSGSGDNSHAARDMNRG